MFKLYDSIESALGVYVRAKENKNGKYGHGFFSQTRRYFLDKSLQRLFAKAYTKVAELTATAYITDEPVPFERKFEGRQMEITIGSQWAKRNFDCAWFRVRGRMPADLPDNAVFFLDIGGEGLVYDKDGNPVQGITNHASEFDYTLGMPYKRVIPNAKNLVENGEAHFYIDAGANDLFGNLRDKARVRSLFVCIPNEQIRALAYDLQVLLTVYDFNKEDEYTLSVYKAAKAALAGTVTEQNAAEIRRKLRPFLDKKNDAPCFHYSAIGHSHLDLAWKWPIRETRRKGARTFVNQLVNIDRYPDYIFGASQAQLYQWIKEEHPDIYAKVREAYEKGRWELQGATWVEMDSNLSGGESLVRQMYYGKKFFLDEFGEDMKILWLPDSFGYSGCLPQVMKLAEVPYFLTQKMSWNTVNKFPYHTFNWVGIDGTKVFAHMLPEDTYNGPLRGDRMTFGERNYAERKISDKSMMLFGIGDGGGGPGFEHCERLERYADLKGMPTVTPRMAKDFFPMLEDGTEYPTHKGELYLERHQGTATTQSKSKYFNRRAEFTLRNYEMVAAMAASKGIELPISLQRLEEMWKEVLLYQFHDILPGSSIDRVYVESHARYSAILKELENAISVLLNKTVSGIVNLNPFPCTKPLKIGDQWYKMLIPAFGVQKPDNGHRITKFYADSGENFIENDRVKVTFEKGFIVSVFDKKQKKEYIEQGRKANLFSQYPDMGDCWDIRPVDYYKKKRTDAEAVEFGTGTDGAMAYARVIYKVGETKIRQVISVLDGESTVRFETFFSYKGDKSMLRVAFPTTVVTDECNFNIQFGHIARKTTENDKVEKAQFEVNGQKFVDLSDGSCGISFISDGKYGYRCKGSVIDVDMFRSPKGGPGTDVDRGEHYQNYELYLHEGALGADTYKEAYYLNNSLRNVGGSAASLDSRFIQCDNECILPEAVQITDEGLVLRLYNCTDKPQTGKLSVLRHTPKAFVNIMGKKLADCDGTLSLHAFELVCVLLIKK